MKLWAFLCRYLVAPALFTLGAALFIYCLRIGCHAGLSAVSYGAWCYAIGFADSCLWDYLHENGEI